MQLEKIRFENLNSLVGRWEIDLTDPEYLSNGIFAIVGPTGSGKSTLLDAISLALFSCTPRLGKIGGTNTNDVMSQGSNQCFAEIEFRTEKGRFCANWFQKRTGKSAQGNFRSIQREISNIETEDLLESSLSKADATVQELIDMNFSEFTRSVLLAQGDFDAFLKAGTSERAPILERITGTEIYSEISKAVFERERTERSILENLRSEIQNITVLDATEEKELKEELAAKNKELESIKKQTDVITKQIDFWKNFEKAQQEIRDWNSQLETVKKQETDFADDASRLERFEKTKPIEPDYRDFVRKKDELSKKTKTLTDKRSEKQKQSGILESQKTAWETASKLYEKARGEKEQLNTLLQTVRALDLQLGNQHKEIQTLQKELNSKEADRKKHDDKISDAQKRLKKIAEKMESLQQYFQDHAGDMKLQGDLKSLRERIENFNTEHESLVEKENEYENSCDELEKAQKPLARELKKLYDKDLFSFPEENKENLDALQEHFEKKESEFQTEKIRLDAERIFLSSVRTLEDRRKHLHDGEPCPLCGSLEHPYAHENVPDSDENEQALKNVDDSLKNLRDQMKSVQKILTLQADVKQKEKEVARLKKECDKIRKQLEKKQKTLCCEVLEYGKEFEGNELSAKTLDTLSKRRDQWMKHQNEHQKLDNEQTGLKETLKGAEEARTRANADVTQINEKLVAAESSHKQLKNERESIFGDKNCDREEKNAAEKVTKCEQESKKKENQLNDTKKVLAVLDSEIVTVAEDTKQRDAELKILEPEINQAIVDAGFSDENDFLDARKTAKDADALNAKKLQLKNERIRLQGLLDNSTKTFELLQKEPQPEKTREELQATQLELQQKHDAIFKETIETDLRLKNNEAQRKLQREGKEKIAAQQKEYYRFKILNELIGAADGKKFRNFAQGLTLDRLIAHANDQLKILKDRFRLVRGGGTSDRDELEIEVCDLWQGNEIRSVKNLSGGESFLVSLALALGLSQMLSKNTNIGSFFLDEGFGTLDEETLETALDALSNLRQSGKLIGVISHVQALKDRIPTQIELQHVSGGHSSVSGPGVKKLS